MQDSDKEELVVTYTAWAQRVYEAIRAREQVLSPEYRSEGQLVMSLAEPLGIQNDDPREVVQAIRNAVEDIERLGLVQLKWGNNDGAVLTSRGRQTRKMAIQAVRLRPEDERLLRAIAEVTVNSRDNYAYRTSADADSVAQGAGFRHDRAALEDQLARLEGRGLLETTPTNQHIGVTPYYPAFARFQL